MTANFFIYEDFLRLLPGDDEGTIPHEVVGLVIKKGMNLLKTWRIHIGFAQREVAKRAGITQAALFQMEKSSNELRSTTLEKLAAALGLTVAQFQD
jgi:DNA-binding XRE family transcriptional regulator